MPNNNKFKKYDHIEIEKKWQDYWYSKNIFKTGDINSNKQKFFGLVEFPYPSGQGLHVGHPRSYTALDIISRKRRMQNYNVLYAIGWDAFGLPTENFAMKNKIHPSIITKNNISRFKSQLKSLGMSFDWDREIDTTDPEYYKWTQWIFLKLFEKNLAYKSKSNVNWCTSCKCVLANEEVVQGKCERCSSEVVQKIKSQWTLKITEYAKKLIEDLELVDYPERVKSQQTHWIGKSTGAEIIFKTNTQENIKIYTTRPETIFGVSYLVISPEHEIIKKINNQITNIQEVNNYIIEASKKSSFERTELNKNKTGVKLENIFAYNPVNNNKIPVYISDYVLTSYGTGAIMAVPAHDTRDQEFAEKFNINIIQVINNNNKLINSGFLDNLDIKDAQNKIIEYIKENKIGTEKTNYKLRDWIFSRQRYWGEPIPIIHCEKCGQVPVPESELPLKLPDININNLELSDDGESPLNNCTDWVNTTCPKCKNKARRETDTMPQWAGSSWYFLRYTDPKNKNFLASKENINYWMPVDWYNGGMEHTTLHLLYSRFWYKFLYDLGVVNNFPEPYKKRTSHGMILGENSEKMSKSRGNVINPDDIIRDYGADTLRIYEMFIGDFEKAAPWNTTGIKGSRRFLERYWDLQNLLNNNNINNNKLESEFNKTIKKVTEDIENMKFNTAIASLMGLINIIYDQGEISKEYLRIFTLLLNPFAPHITEEVYKNCNLGENLACQQTWPEYNLSKCTDSETEIVLQINGKLRAKLKLPVNLTQEQVHEKFKNTPEYIKFTSDKQIIKVIYVKDKILNIVLK